jgi:peptidoglycan/xylan/chitin deacetylase (PgdA/CDA1 family)
MEVASRPRLQIAFTLDYEIFGDGTGSVLREQCIPTEYLAQVLECHDAKLTLFVETGQLIFFNSHGMQDKAGMVEAQIRDLYMRGHDVQLHVHPMWFFADPPGPDGVTLDPAIFDLSMLEPPEIERIVVQSIDYLKSVIAPVDRTYAPVAYRAGAWSIQRIEPLFEILARHGIIIDSTIAPGAHLAEGSYGRYDFTNLAMDASWRLGPLYEFPILTARSRFSPAYHANPAGLAARRIVQGRYSNPLTLRKKSKLQKLRYLLSRDFHMADYNFLSAERLARMVMQHAKNHAACDSLPIVLIGHSKATYYVDRVYEFFTKIEAAGFDFEVVRLRDFVIPVSSLVPR